MPRNVPWRHTISDFTCASQAFALQATVYILRQMGPTGFLLKEEGEQKNVKVFLGDPHSCTCAIFHKEKDLCKHICWILLKKVRLDKDDPLSRQLGLSDIEMDSVMRRPVEVQQSNRRTETESAVSTHSVASGKKSVVVARREICGGDVCPICQDEFLDKKLPVTYCKFGCGNNVHIKCMKVWAEHLLKSSIDQSIKCPMCREDFGPFATLNEELHNATYRPSYGSVSVPSSSQSNMQRHVGIHCHNCQIAPIHGKCYRCCTCPVFYLCQTCFNTPSHTNHAFQFRQKRNQRWRPASRMLGLSTQNAVPNELFYREIISSDYETLLELDNPRDELSHLTEESLHSLPVEKVREWGPHLRRGAQCMLCLRPYVVGQHVRRLPCHHEFHKCCIDSWLLHSQPHCPVDFSPVSLPRQAYCEGERQRHQNVSKISQKGRFPAVHEDNNNPDPLSEQCLGISTMHLGAGRMAREQHGRRAVFASRQLESDYQMQQSPVILELTGTQVKGDVSDNRDRNRYLNVVCEHQLMANNAGTQLDQRTVPCHMLSGETQCSTNPLLNGSENFVDENRLQFQSLTSNFICRKPAANVKVTCTEFQDIYLGGNPKFNPPADGEVSLIKNVSSSGQNTSLTTSSIVKKPNHFFTNSIAIEGTSVKEHLALRDIL